MKTIATIIHLNIFPLMIADNNGNLIFYEDLNGNWQKWQFDSNNKKTHWENSNGDTKYKR